MLYRPQLVVAMCAHVLNKSLFFSLALLPLELNIPVPFACMHDCGLSKLLHLNVCR